MASLAEADTQGWRNFVTVGAIDFGTSYSGYAYSFKHAPETVYTKHWFSSTRGITAEKTPTCILFDKNKIFSQFGFNAEDKYWQSCDERDEDNWYFFSGFKLALYNEMRLMEDQKISDELGREFPLLDVVSETLRYLNDTMIEDYKKRVNTFDENDMLRVVTVPAIWSDSARNFMRKAAVKAGIPEHLLNICLEPEAAAVYCRTVHCKPQRQGSDSKLVEFRPGDKYLVLDAGGGTVDIVVHEIEESGGFKELHPACGGDWGGTLVDKAFTDYVSSCLGEKVFNKFRQQEKYDYMDVMREFEAKKRSMVPMSDENKKFVLRVPISLYEMYKAEQQNKMGSTSKAENVHFIGDKMRLSHEIILTFYSDSTKEIGNNLTEILANPSLKDVDTIIMVGGYSDSLILQSFIDEKFQQKTVIVPNEAAVAVLKGAVIFGHDPTVISERRCRYTYGIQACMLFDENIDQESKKIIDEDGKIRARDRFSVHVTIGQNVKTGVFQPSTVYTPSTREQTSVVFRLFASSDARPIYTDETGCQEINSRSIDISDLTGRLSEKVIQVSLCFSGPLITVKAIKKQTGEEISNKIKYQWSEGLERQAEISTSGKSISEEKAVCAVMIGTTFSSFAVSFKHDLKSMYSKYWQQYGWTDDKVLNFILFDQNKRFHAFGDEAEKLYHQKKGGTSTDWFFFKNCTRVLYDKHVKTDSKIKDEQGRAFPLLPVVSETISYIVRHPNIAWGMDMNMRLHTGESYVFLVPSGLTESARSFLKNAIEKAGIPEEKLCFCSGLEATVSYCKFCLSMEFEQSKGYLAVIFEGDRVEFEVFGVDASGVLTGVCDLEGGNWGCSMVYNRFTNMLYEVFGDCAIDGLKMANSYELMRQFTYKMLSARPASAEQERISIKIPSDLLETIGVDGDKKVTKQGLRDICFSSDKMRFTHEKMLEFHEESLATIGNHLDKIFAMPAHKDISTLIMIGDYAESRILQDYIGRRFSSKKLIVSEHERDALLKGAIQYGFRNSSLL